MSASQQQLKQKIENKNSVKLNDLRKTNNPTFEKSKDEKDVIKLMKKQHNKNFRKLFGTKRPTAGIVRKMFPGTS